MFEDLRRDGVPRGRVFQPDNRCVESRARRTCRPRRSPRGASCSDARGLRVIVMGGRLDLGPASLLMNKGGEYESWSPYRLVLPGARDELIAAGAFRVTKR